jgi:hypothetical protein
MTFSRRTAQSYGPTEFVMDIKDKIVQLFPVAKPKRVSADVLTRLRLEAEFNANSTDAKSWRELVLALTELEERRQEETWRG